MRRLDRRGMASWEFCVIGAVFFLVLFAIIDLGRYIITVQSLRTLAGTGARQITMNSCYVNYVLRKEAPTGCPTDPLSTAQKQDAAPFLFFGGLTPTLAASTGASPITVTASQPGFTMIFPVVWGTTFDAPSATTRIPY